MGGDNPNILAKVISQKHQCIFVHIPKCGGSSIEDVVWPGVRTEQDLWMGFVDEFRNRHQTGGLQHLCAHQIRDEVGEEQYLQFWKFAFVRNPFDRAVSQFVYMNRRPDLRRFLGMSEGASFGEYLQLITETQHVQWKPQSSFILDPETGEIMVDFVARFERYSTDARAIFDRLGIRVGVVPHANQGLRGNYRDYYSEADRKMVQALCGDDLEIFQYLF